MARSLKIRDRVDKTLDGADALIAKYSRGVNIEIEITGSLMDVLQGKSKRLPFRIVIDPRAKEDHAR